MATSRERAPDNQEGVNLVPVTNRIFSYEGFTKQGDRCSFLVHAFRGAMYKDNLQTLRDIAVVLDQGVFHIPFDQALNEVNQNVKSESGSILLANVLETEVRGRERLRDMSFWRMFNIGLPQQVSEPESGYIAYSSQQSWVLQTEKGPKKVMYVSTIAILADYRRLGLGAYFLGVANALHQPDIIIFRTRSGAATAALRKSMLIEGSIYSLERRFNEDPDMAGALDLADQKTIHPNPIDPETGLTKAVYLERCDRAYVPDRSHKVSYDDYCRMRKLGLVSADGDGMYVGGKVKGRFNKESTVEELIAA